MDIEVKNFQLSDIFKALDIKNEEEAEKIFSNVFSLLAYLKLGDRITTSLMHIEKIDHNLLYLDLKYDSNILVDALGKRKVIKLPI